MIQQHPRDATGAMGGQRHRDGGGAAGPDAQMLSALLVAGERLAEALRAENAALAALDIPRAAGLADGKIRATDAFAAAQQAAVRTGARATGDMARLVARLATDLEGLGSENQRLLRRAVGIQSRVIEVIAGAALPRTAGERDGARYGASGRRSGSRSAPALAVRTRA